MRANLVKGFKVSAGGLARLELRGFRVLRLEFAAFIGLALRVHVPNNRHLPKTCTLIFVTQNAST